jgi:hypothetical protein
MKICGIRQDSDIWNKIFNIEDADGGSHTEKTARKHNLSGLVMEPPKEREEEKDSKTRGDENWRQRL